jgi:hypothetical protein
MATETECQPINQALASIRQKKKKTSQVLANAMEMK